MEITIKTTKLKSSHIKQMQWLTLEEIETLSPVCLGFVYKVLKYHIFIDVFQLSNDEYRIYPSKKSIGICEEQKVKWIFSDKKYFKEYSSREEVMKIYNYINGLNVEQIYI